MPDPTTTFAERLSGSLTRPARFKLVFSSWAISSDELTSGAHAGWSGLVDIVAAAQRSGALPAAEPQRMTSLLRSLTHGAVDLALAGHLAADGKGGADPVMLVDDLLGYLEAATDAGRAAVGKDLRPVQ